MITKTHNGKEYQFLDDGTLVIDQSATEKISIPAQFVIDAGNLRVNAQYYENDRQLAVEFTMFHELQSGEATKYAIHIRDYSMEILGTKKSRNKFIKSKYVLSPVDHFSCVGGRDLVTFQVFTERGSFRFGVMYPSVDDFETGTEYCDYYFALHKTIVSSRYFRLFDKEKILAHHYDTVKKIKIAAEWNEVDAYVAENSNPNPTLIEKFLLKMEGLDKVGEYDRVIIANERDMTGVEPRFLNMPHILVDYTVKKIGEHKYRFKRICQIAGIPDSEAIRVIAYRTQKPYLAYAIDFDKLKTFIDRFHPAPADTESFIPTSWRIPISPAVVQWLEK